MATGIQISIVRANPYAQQRLNGCLIVIAGQKKAYVDAIAESERTPLQGQVLRMAESILIGNGAETRSAQMMPAVLQDAGVEPLLPNLTAQPGLLTAQQEADLDAAVKAAIDAVWDTFAATVL